LNLPKQRLAMTSIPRPDLSTLLPELIFALALAIFLLSPVSQVTDSEYSMLLSESLLYHGSFELGHYAIPHEEPKWFRYYFQNGEIYQLEAVNGRLYYNFPPGSSILSIPFVAVANALGVSAANSDGTYNPRGEEKIERVLAAILAAGLVCLFFYLARLVLPIWWSVLVAIGGGLGTQVWSTASRSLWSDTWGSFLLGVVLLMLFGAATGRFRMRPILLATLLSWMYFARPTFAVHIIGITVYVFLYYRSLLIRYAVTGAIWLALFISYSWHLYGHLLPSYYRASRLQSQLFWTALAANLISPARGLLVYVPVVFFIGYLLARYWRRIVYPRLAVLSLAIVAMQILSVSGLLHWWGGASFGARFSTGLVPWFVLLAIIGLQARLGARWESDVLKTWARKLELAAGAGLLLISVCINGLGATSTATWIWNARPSNIDDHPERNWDWRQPQFLAGFLDPPRPRITPIATGDLIDFSKPDADAYLWYGWSPAEKESRWTEGREAALIFRLNAIQDLLFSATLHAFAPPGQHLEQRVDVKLNGTTIQNLSFKDDARHEISFALPAKLLRLENTLAFSLPDAASPNSLQLGDDRRELGIAVYWIQFSFPGAQTSLPARVNDSRRRDTEPRAVATGSPSSKRRKEKVTEAVESEIRSLQLAVL
jgi:hypothetical protein